TLITVLIVKRKLLLKVDYSLLFTFVFFFIFVGNAGRIDAIRDFISNIVIGREILVAAALSQVLSNVPTTVMLSGFTDNAIDLLKGVTLGGLGTPIASMASLITYKFYVKSKNANVGAYMKYFLFINFAFMAILMIYALYS
ncbi:MAG: citrate transporter, partial [Ruminococcus sp.]|nr:citrate transporter [Ruminococcus sp.]